MKIKFFKKIKEHPYIIFFSIFIILTVIKYFTTNELFNIIYGYYFTLTFILFLIIITTGSKTKDI